MSLPSHFNEFIERLERSIDPKFDVKLHERMIVQDMIDFYRSEPPDIESWYVGDRINIQLSLGDTLDDVYEIMTANAEPDEEVMTYEQLRTQGLVSLHWPPKYRRHDKSWLWHYEMWVQETYTGDGLRRYLATLPND